MEFLEKYQLSTRYRICQALTIMTPFMVKRRSFRAFFYMFFASSFVVCPEFLTAIIFDKNQMAKEIEPTPEYKEPTVDPMEEAVSKNEEWVLVESPIEEILENVQDKKDF